MANALHYNNNKKKKKKQKKKKKNNKKNQKNDDDYVTKLYCVTVCLHISMRLLLAYVAGEINYSQSDQKVIIHVYLPRAYLTKVTFK